MIVGLAGAASAQVGARASDADGLALERGIPVVLGLIGLAAVAWFWRKDVIRLGSFRRRPGVEAPEPARAPVLFAIGLGCVALASLAQIAAMGAMGAMGVDPGAGLTLRQMGWSVLAVGPVSLLAAVGSLALAHRLCGCERFRLSARGWGPGFLLGLAVLPMAAAVSAITVFLAGFLGHPPADPIAHDTLDAILDPEGGPWRWVLIVGAVAVTPVVEEALFRGLLQSSLAAILPWRWSAVILATAIFTLAHTGGGVDWHSLPAIATIGLAMGIAYERTGRIAVPVAMHAVFNGANVALAMLL